MSRVVARCMGIFSRDLRDARTRVPPRRSQSEFRVSQCPTSSSAKMIDKKSILPRQADPTVAIDAIRQATGASSHSLGRRRRGAPIGIRQRSMYFPDRQI